VPRRRKRFILILLACGVVVIGLVAFRSTDPGPSYQGKTLKDWMNIYCWPDNPTAVDLFPRKVFFEGREARQNEAADAVRHIGTNAIPTFLAWQDKDSSIGWKLKLLAVLPKRLQARHSVD
jgi:hypothetical protein